MPKKPDLASELKKIRQQELERVAERKVKSLGIPYLNLFGVPIQQEALLLSTKEESKRGEFLIFKKSGRRVGIATINPKNPLFQEVVHKLTKKGFEVAVYFISLQSFRGGWEQYDKMLPSPKKISGAVEISSDRIEKFLKQIQSIDTVKTLLGNINLARVTEGLEIVFSASIQLDASDIHLEPSAENALLRFRIDGILQNVVVFSLPIYKKFLSRIKILSGLKLNIAATAQDGRFSIDLGGVPIEIRTSTIPTKNGESIVLRILNPKKLISFEELGLRDPFRRTLERELAKTTGILLVTGPTGSGKTTTLYAFLKKLTSPDVKIITIEDPIEYRLPNISQTQVDPKKNYTFSSGLRAILRQDPDVVLVGEIRDKTTAETALHAALTGHLVFSTLHTNDAVGVIARLVDMDVNPNIIAPAINIAVAQRLIRKVCPKCKKLLPPRRRNKKPVEKIL